MTRNEAALRIAAGVAAALICYLILEYLTKDLSVTWKALIVTAALVISLAVAFWSGQKKPNSELPQTKVASDIESGGAVNVKGVSVRSDPDRSANVGTNITAEKDVSVKNIDVDHRGKSG